MGDNPPRKQKTMELKLIDIQEEKDNIKIIHGQECEEILRDNYELKKYSNENWQACDNLKKVGSIPWAVWLFWESVGITEDPKELLRALERNPEFKTTEKRLI